MRTSQADIKTTAYRGVFQLVKWTAKYHSKVGYQWIWIAVDYRRDPMIRILIGDPDSATRKALASLLQRKVASNTIIEVENIEGLIRQSSDMPPDLLLLDWRLDGSPAPEICKLIQRAYPLLKIILFSVDANDAAAAKEAGAIFIHKGASPDGLIAMLKPLLSQQSTNLVNPDQVLNV